MTDLGLLKQFLGLEIMQSEARINISKNKYVPNLLLKFKMVECKTSKFPFISSIKIGEFGESPLVDNSLSRQLVASFLYLTHSRPDLEYYIGVFARYMQEPHEIHWKDAKKILYYVHETKHFRVHYPASYPL